MTTEVCSARFPHSDISGSMDICSSPKLFAAYHVFHRLLVPRHPPCALISLTSLTSAFTFGLKVYSVTLSGLWFSSFDIPFGISLGCLDIFFFEDSIFSSFNMWFSRYMLSTACLITVPVGLSGLEPPTSRLSGVRSNRLSYKPG